MKKIYQKAGDGQCLTACIATLTGATLAEVSNITWAEVSNAGAYYRRLRRFLRPRGLCLIGFPCRPEVYHEAAYILVGRSPRSTEGSHSVVMRGGKMIHDPHRSGKGIRNPFFAWALLPLPRETP